MYIVIAGLSSIHFNAIYKFIFQLKAQLDTTVIRDLCNILLSNL